MRLFLFAVALVIAVLGCSDGKLNLQLVFWGDHDEPGPAEKIPTEPKPSSSSIAPKPSSSSVYVSSSAEELPSSSSEERSSSSKPPRSSSAKTDSLGYTYEDYPTLEVGAPNVKKAVTTRYWDGCKPHCSWPEHIGNPKPWAIAKSCDKSGYNEIPLLFLDPRSDQWGTYWGRTPSAWDAGTPEATSWLNSETYKDWIADPAKSTKNSLAYTCFDLAPYAVNDTLAYAFAATGKETLPCGKCARLQFNSEWSYDKNYEGNSKPRVTHRALKGKTLIVMANNTGTVGENQFDIMIPGGGAGAVNCFSEQLGLPPKSDSPEVLGRVMGGLLSECSYNADQAIYGVPSDRYTLEQWKDCLERRCHRAFDGRQKELLDGCLWHVEWFMAADNPEAEWVETPCPKYLLDRYGSTATTKLPDCYTSNPRTCQIDGVNSN